MGKKEFDIFLKKEAQYQKPEVNWSYEKKNWLANLENLFSDVQTWLREYVDAGKVRLEFNDIDIQEEVLGTYQAKELKIFIGNKMALLTPIGTILIGTRGRADLSGRAGTIKFILADKNATGPKIEVNVFTEDNKINEGKSQGHKPKTPLNLVWKITSNPPKIDYTDLNQDTFLQCLMEVIK